MFNTVEESLQAEAEWDQYRAAFEEWSRMNEESLVMFERLHQ